jgi:hypothetical protein
MSSLWSFGVCYTGAKFIANFRKHENQYVRTNRQNDRRPGERDALIAMLLESES